MKKVTKPNNIINIKPVKEDSNITLVNTEGYFVQRFNFEDYFDNTKLTKFVKNCEKQIRKSNEYSKYIGDLKNNKGLTHCAILGNISDQDAKVEFHHYPFTLYDIVMLCVNKHIVENKPFNTFTICRKVLNDHSRNIIGLVPLCTTAHQLVHAGKIFLNLNKVYGKLNEFVQEYYHVLNDELIEKYNKLIDMSAANIVYSDEDILKVIQDNKNLLEKDDLNPDNDEWIVPEIMEEKEVEYDVNKLLDEFSLPEEDNDEIDV